MHFQFLASPAFKHKYERAAALLSNKLGKVTMEGVFTVVLEDYIERNSPEGRQARREKRRLKHKESGPVEIAMH